MTEQVSVQRGQRVPLSETTALELAVECGNSDLGVLKSAVLVFDGSLGKTAPIEAVFTGRPSAYDGALDMAPGGMRYRMKLEQIPADVQRIVLILWVTEGKRRLAGNLAGCEKLTARLYDSSAAEVACFSPQPTDYKLESAVIHCEVYRKNGWRFRADGSGFGGGLPALGHRLKLEPEAYKAMDGAPSTSTEDGSPAPVGSADPNPARALPVHVPKHWAGGVTPKFPSGLMGAVARVLAIQTTGETHTGSAFAITPGGCLVTCHHVVEDTAALAVVFHGSEEARPVRVLASDPNTDVALIRLEDAAGCPTWLQMADAEETVELGTDVGLLGFPGIGVEINYSKGIVNSIRDRHGLPWVQFDAGAASGSSGGPLLRCEDGKVLGVVGTVVTGQAIAMNVNLAMSVKALTALGWVKTGD